MQENFSVDSQKNIIKDVMMKKVAVVLSGCGVFDGSEIHESVLTLLALDNAGARAVCTAPNIDQFEVVNHLTQRHAVGESRNVLVESARIARGKITPLEKFDLNSVDAVIFPGGSGAAKNLSSYAHDKAEYTVLGVVADFIRKAHEAGKPMGFICIAPVIAAKVLGLKNPKLTIGSDAETAAVLEKKGAKHVMCSVEEAVVDEEHKIVTTPAYMLANGIAEAQKGINQLVERVLGMI